MGPQQTFFFSIVFLLLSMLSFTAFGEAHNTHPQDPYEHYNRQMFTFNRTLDHALFIPVAKTYQFFVMPQVRTSVTNVYRNIDAPTIVIDDLLQGDFINAMGDTWRFVINSTFGILGIFDVASHMQVPIPYHYNDFGLTLARWGVTQSPYLVLPVLGPSTPRDAVGILVDYYAFSVYPWIRPHYVRYAILGLYYVNTRSNFLDYQHLLAAATLDPYVFQRNAYLQRRQFLIQQMEQTIYDEYHPTRTFHGYFLHPTPRWWQHRKNNNV